VTTLSVFCIGTGHTQDEQWNLLRALYDLTDATETDRESATTSPPADPNGQFKLIFDGPETFFTSNEQLRANRDAAVDVIRIVNPKRICLFGHSRGAVLATMIAGAIRSRNADVRLWLLDLVTHTDWKGGFPTIPPEESRTIYSNVNEVVRVVMEDEFNVPLMFPLEDVRVAQPPPEKSDWQRFPPGSTRGSFVRMPGGHGSGTQVNPIRRPDAELGVGDITTADPSSLWPIGEACLIHALDKCAAWGVRLESKAGQYRAPGRLVESYARIRLVNGRRADRHILLNDCDKSSSSYKQKLSHQWGRRSSEALLNFGLDRRFDPLIVNYEHWEALEAELQRLSNAGLISGYNELLEFLRPADDRLDQIDVALLQTELKAIREHLPFTYHAAVSYLRRELERRAQSIPEPPDAAGPVTGADPPDTSSESTVVGVIAALERPGAVDASTAPTFVISQDLELVENIVTLSNTSVTILSTSPVNALLESTATFGGVAVDVSVMTGSKTFSIRRSQTASQPWTIASIAEALNIDASGVGHVAIDGVELTGSLTTELFRAYLCLVEDGDPMGAVAIGWRVTGGALEFGLLGEDKYIAFGAAAALGNATGRIGGRFQTGATRGWKFEIEAQNVDKTVFEELGWGDVDVPANLRLDRVLLSHDNATSSSEVVIEIGLDAPLGIGSALAELIASLDGASTAAIPEFLNHVSLTSLRLTYVRENADTVINMSCVGNLGVSLDDPGKAAADRAATPTIELELEVSKAETTFNGTLLLGDVALRLSFIDSGDTRTAIGTYVAADDHRLDRLTRDEDPTTESLSGLVLDLSKVAPASLGVPSVTVSIDKMLFAWRKQGQRSKMLMSISLDAGGGFDSDIPVVGDLFPGDGLAVGGTLVVTSDAFTEAEVTSIRVDLDADVEFPLPEGSIRKGFSLIAHLDMGGEMLAVGNGERDSAGPPAGTNHQTTPVAESDPTTWKQVQRSFGPVHVARVGVAFVDKKIALRLDASITLGGLELSMVGLGLLVPIELVAGATAVPGVELAGIGVSFTNPQVEISGTFQRSGDDFLGKATIRTKAFTVVAFGGLGSVAGQLSLFIYAVLKREFGGPPVARLTGLALGFGYNRDFVPPALEAVQGHPFILALEADPPNGQTDDDRIDAASSTLSTLGSAVPGRVGAYWVAAGVTFESFGIINTRALAVVRLAGEVEILLLGVSELTLPRGAPAQRFVRAELALKVSIKPEAGIMLAQGRLTDRSFVLDPSCRITGQFAVAMWFGNHEKSGDFVMSLGGYHPHFRPPGHYPVVPRLGLTLIKGALTIKAEAYFALTPSAVMAGGQLEAVYQSGALWASFTLRAHFLISWKPFYYDIEIGISIRVSVIIDTWLGRITISASLGASVRVWGPELAGRGRVSWGALSFDVEFGAISAGPRRPAPLSWPQFKSAFLPASGICTIEAPSGVLAEHEDGLGNGESETQWLVTADTLVLSFRTAVPVSKVVLRAGRPNGSEFNAPLDGWEHDRQLGVQPMGTMPITSEVAVEIAAIVGGQERLVNLAEDWDRPSFIRQGVPAQLWNATALPAKPSSDMLAGRIVGFDGLRPRDSISTNNQAPRAISDFEFLELTLRLHPLVAAPASSVKPADEPTIDVTTEPKKANGETPTISEAMFARMRIAETKAGALANRHALIEAARTAGFLPDDLDDPTVALALPVLAADLADAQSDIFASSPMLGTGVLGGPAAPTAVERPIERPPSLDFSVPEEVARLIVRLLKELAVRPYIETDGTATNNTTASTSDPAVPAMVIAHEADDNDDDSIERPLGIGDGLMFDLGLEGVGSRLSSDVDALRLVELDLGTDESVPTRVTAVDRYGTVLDDGIRSGVVDLDPRVARLFVVGVGQLIDPPDGAVPASGWIAESALVRIAPNVYVADDGVVEVQIDPATDLVATRGGEVVRANTIDDRDAGDEPEALPPAPGWVRTMLPGTAETVGVRMRRTGDAMPVGARLDVTVVGEGESERLTHSHILHESETEAVLLYRVPNASRSTDPSRTLVANVQVSAIEGWELAGVLGYAAEPHVVRQRWQPGVTGLRTPSQPSGQARTVKLVKRNVA